MALKEEAQQYVGTDEISGALQLELLKREGCLPGSKVLEIGCGTLSAGYPLIQYLDKGNYVGIEPNNWLIDCALEQLDVRTEVENKRALFLHVSDFDASQVGVTFDFILSHSVLSHAAGWQLKQFLQNSAKVITPQGRILASIRLAEGNEYGSVGSPNGEDSNDGIWQYPGVSFFKMSTVISNAKISGLRAELKSEYTKFYTDTRPSECHDWFVFKKIFASW